MHTHKTLPKNQTSHMLASYFIFKLSLIIPHFSLFLTQPPIYSSTRPYVCYIHKYGIPNIFLCIFIPHVLGLSPF